MVQYTTLFLRWMALKAIQLLGEVQFGFEEVDALLILVKSSVSEGLVQISRSRIRRLLTLIAGSPSFFCKKVGMCTEHFCDFTMLYCTPGSCVTSSGSISEGEPSRGRFSLSQIMLIWRSRRSTRSLHSPTFPIGLRSESDGLFGLHWESTGTSPPANFCQIVSPSPSPIRAESKWNPSPTRNS